ncbi:FAD-dependent 5-carboxymethylaminomethyl-2-thiouridine(34) oxidoreductase MnmC [Glaciimonas sp. PCH181]|uniref:FAD-dependent 5-carboxymethylaminomethyl-2-thiouridine(34) oxidoreductase MnmC n=1 Tax=Glaciimonas sp. PCH181 TaxID=2133943 RepID=UPI000D3C2E33|nr:FAD-dependent 5-carboxymethylaminomethyl-2-thiouridine(34) oxidoreductase MnmC [Glaciimonas sp. PCH181]PUA18177.1 tRNA U-34 5-methylaminomethyl-2-thiouridine biosynthesis protein [Glaciimonas sp. PCH181]
MIEKIVAEWRQKSSYTVLDTAFEAGQQFLAIWQAWRDDAARPQQLHYLAWLPTGLSIAEMAQKQSEWAELSEALLAVWPVAVPGFHRIYLDQNQIVLTLMIGDSAKCVQQIDARIDAFYLSAQDWPLSLWTRLGRLAKAQAILRMPMSSDSQQKMVENAGFVFENTPGAAVKNACFCPRWRITTPRTQPPPVQRHAIILGAGLAGAAACQRLALRGWKVTLIERHANIAQEASGNLAGIFMPLLSRDDNPTSRLSRNAYLFARHVWQSLGGIGNGFSGAACGVLQIARDAAHAEAQQNLSQQTDFPAEYAQWLAQPAASALLGAPVSGGGWLFPGGGWVHPQSLCRAMLQACGSQLQTHFNVSASTLIKMADSWQVCDENGAEIATAPVVILANGMGALSFPQTCDLPLTAIRGQVTYLDAESAPAIMPVLCGDGYLTPAINGLCSIGATYDNDAETALRQSSQDENLARLHQILPDWTADVTVLPLTGRVGFRCVATDRLPLVGALPDTTATSPLREPQLKDIPRLPGLYGLLGYASRGLIWAPLAAELLAAELNDEPLPIEAELAAALDPARFILKAQRRTKP